MWLILNYTNYLGIEYCASDSELKSQYHRGPYSPVTTLTMLAGEASSSS